MAFSTCSFHHQVSRCQRCGRVVPHTSSVVLSSPVLMLFQISSVAPSATPADVLTCKLKTTWKWLLVWGSLSFQTLRRGVNLRLDFGGTYKKLMLQSYFLTRDHFYICDKFAHGPTEKDEVCMVLRKRMKSICVAMFPDLYVMRWLSRFLKYVFPRSRSNAWVYSRILSPSTSGSGLPYPIPPCTSLYPVPARPTWPFQSPHGIRNSDVGILAVTARSWSKNRSLTSSLRQLCGAYTDRKITTRWPTMSFTKIILSETLNLKNFLYPLFCHKLSYTSSAFVISWPVELVSDVLALDCAAAATAVSGLLNAADIHFPVGSCFHYLANSSSQGVHIEFSHPEFPQVLAGFATMARPCLPHLTGGQAGDVTNRMPVGTA